ncbi:MAG: 30S ribosomal protein S18 [Acidobacteriota bacterium]|nr:30S ribosomal protein S18 [Acidobacteriota bacterium]
MAKRRRYCKFCSDKVDYIDYKDVRTLSTYVPEGSKMTPRRISGVCSIHQKKLSRAIKQARHLALLSYIPS